MCRGPLSSGEQYGMAKVQTLPSGWVAKGVLTLQGSVRTQNSGGP